MSEKALLLGVDTCGESGSIALGEVGVLETGLSTIALLGESTLTGGDYAATLVTSIADLLGAHSAGIRDVAGLVVVAGPGSFTGIRTGLAAVKAFAEVWGLPVIAVSRLNVLMKAASEGVEDEVRSAVLNAHRGQFYCRYLASDQRMREILLTAGEINSMESLATGGLAMGGLPQRVAVCEEPVAQAIESLLEMEPLRVKAPTAWNALRYCLERWSGKDFEDVATLDGYYLRGVDAKVSSR